MIILKLCDSSLPGDVGTDWLERGGDILLEYRNEDFISVNFTSLEHTESEEEKKQVEQ
jgi:hypothetical protein